MALTAEERDAAQKYESLKRAVKERIEKIIAKIDEEDNAYGIGPFLEEARTEAQAILKATEA